MIRAGPDPHRNPTVSEGEIRHTESLLRSVHILYWTRTLME